MCIMVKSCKYCKLKTCELFPRKDAKSGFRSRDCVPCYCSEPRGPISWDKANTLGQNVNYGLPSLAKTKRILKLLTKLQLWLWWLLLVGNRTIFSTLRFWQSNLQLKAEMEQKSWNFLKKLFHFPIGRKKHHWIDERDSELPISTLSKIAR